jgi:sugar (glycoside-pentoside-hexuronide) transporter
VPLIPAPRLTPFRQAVYALGDLAVNTALASLTLLYAAFFLTQVAGLRPVLAGLVPLIGRVVDAVTDPIMGRISDRTRWRAGRRRPYFLIAALPFGLSFAALWLDLPAAGQAGRFAYYAAMYCLLSLSMTVLAIPYLALVPEMAVDYDQRTSLNTYRNAGALLGVLVAVGIRPLAEACGGGAAGYAAAGAVVGAALVVPWPLVYRASFERREFRRRRRSTAVLPALGDIARHRSFTRLTAAFLGGRIAMDLIGTLLILYVSFWIGRSAAFEMLMGCFLLTVLLALPLWLRLARGRDKAHIFIAGSLWWVLVSPLFLLATPQWPLWALILVAAMVGVGYAAVDVMPWAMLGEVIDEDDLASGERREGLYNGIFTFLRKLAGAVAVFLTLGCLDLLGFQPAEAQTESVRQAIRWLTACAPALLLAAGAAALWRYPLTRAAHAAIRAELLARRG